MVQDVMGTVRSLGEELAEDDIEQLKGAGLHFIDGHAEEDGKPCNPEISEDPSSCNSEKSHHSEDPSPCDPEISEDPSSCNPEKSHNSEDPSPCNPEISEDPSPCDDVPPAALNVRLVVFLIVLALLVAIFLLSFLNDRALHQAKAPGDSGVLTHQFLRPSGVE
eukprot:CAMPEP_0115208504 /NCGR_PEP_ID=MMETSP0270-20121206/21260_1 /TAXON_ID=71861 /ORGANISM="Scrippsiella trochoidea, Strain CCMP3099" /LENGTH=163 /DNA_ID=CAMNT_0002622119 /DNA_START=65 /DNA_END=556 /DNA_ORIENTATION=+